MNEFKIETEYDKLTNIVVIKYINHPATKDDVDKAVETVKTALEGDGKHKLWMITDLTRLKLSKANLVIDFFNKINPSLIYYAENTVEVTTSAFGKIALSLFNVFSRDKSPSVRTVDEAIKIIKGWQKEGGIFPCLHGEPRKKYKF